VIDGIGIPRVIERSGIIRGGDGLGCNGQRGGVDRDRRSGGTAEGVVPGGVIAQGQGTKGGDVLTARVLPGQGGSPRGHIDVVPSEGIANGEDVEGGGGGAVVVATAGECHRQWVDHVVVRGGVAKA